MEELISSYYNFSLKEGDKSGDYWPIPIKKIGNNKLMNHFFEQIEEIKISKIGPVESLGGYIGYVFTFKQKDGDVRKAVFQTGSESLPYGMFRAENMEDAILFLINEQLEFEVYVFNYQYRDAIHLLQQMKDGGFDHDIDAVKNRYQI